MGLFFNRNKRQDADEEYYRDVYEEHTGRRPTRPFTEEEKADLEILDEEMWDDEE